jgi:signal transduction histidine kinase/ligand-binding sensor domain-containing protein/CheY-like chemotaxis protein/AraC-like DNA-binding protein
MNMMERFGIMCLFLLLLFSNNTGIYSQNEVFKTEIFTTEEGLSHNYANCVVQDKYGFIWIGTHKGLNRFDGYSFKTYYNDPNSSKSISSGYIETIIKDKKGNIWIGTNRGLDMFDYESESFVNVSKRTNNNSFKQSQIKSLLEDPNGDIWVGTYGGGLFKINTSNFQVVEHYAKAKDKNTLSSDYINTLYFEAPATLYIGTWEGGLTQFNTQSKTFKRYVNITNSTTSKGITINTIAKNIDGTFLLGTWSQGVCQFNPQKKGIEKYTLYNKIVIDENTPIVSINIDKDGLCWLATFNKGILVFDNNNKSTYSFNIENAEPFNIKRNNIWKLYEDNKGIIWVASYGSGIIKINKHDSKFQHLAIKNAPNSKLSSSYTSTIAKGDGNTIWIGTSEGLRKYNWKSKSFEAIVIKKSVGRNLLNTFIHALFIDKNNNLWIGCDGGINKYNLASCELSYFNPAENVINPHYKPNDIGFYSFCEDNNGNIWMGTYSYGLYKYNPYSNDCKHYSYNENNVNSISNNVTWYVKCDSKNNVWIATLNGLNKYDEKHDNFKRFKPDTLKKGSLSYEFVSYVYEDRKHNLWIATLGGGINEYNYKSESFSYVTNANGLANDDISAIVEDNSGSLWFSTAKGISNYNPQTKVVMNYDINSGLSDNSFSLGVCFESNDNNLVFGGNNGLEVLNAEGINLQTDTPRVVISDFKIFNQSVVPGVKANNRIILSKSINSTNELNLNYDDYVISFEFASLDYISPKSNRYAYKLEGFDKDWIQVDAKRRFASYTNLLPGTYTFRVIATNHIGEWNLDGKSIIIKISPPYWKTLWFKILTSLLLVLLVYLFIWSRIRIYSKQKHILKELVLKKTTEITRQNQVLENKNQELSRQKEEIIEMTEKIKEADEKKISFFTNISHELRTPLTLILGPLENIMQENKQNPQNYEQLKVVFKNANRLYRLINNLLDFRKIDNDSMKVQLAINNIVMFVNDVVYVFEVIANKKGIDLYYSHDVDEFNLYFDFGKLEIILYNLLSNALKYTETGGKVKVNLVTNSDSIQIQIQDNGIGINEKELNNIFNRYYQIETTSSVNKGTGIGLALTKELVELMDGNINVVSEVGKGSTFAISLPVLDLNSINKHKFIVNENVNRTIDEQTLALYLPDDVTESIQENISNTNGAEKILIVDDNDDLRHYIKNCLKDKYTVFEARDGKEGISVAINKLPQLIISDIMMPEVSGIELCHQIKTNIVTSHIPVILLTAKTATETQIEGYQTGADDYITKPFQKELLMVRIQNLIESREKLRKVFKTKVELEPAEITVTSTDERFIMKAMEIVESNIDNPDLGAAELVNGLGMSRSVVHVKFKELTGLSTSEFIKTIRFKRACQLLKQNKHRVSEICYLVGFTDPHYFSKSFKKMYGASPAQYADGIDQIEKK